MPYCPICKQEYRAGFGRCCHCLASLVDSSSEADAAKVVLLWEGFSRQKFEAIVAALHGANIPSQAKCGADAEKARGNPIARLADMKTTKHASWQVSVLEADYERAQSVTAKCA